MTRGLRYPSLDAMPAAMRERLQGAELRRHAAKLMSRRAVEAPRVRADVDHAPQAVGRGVARIAHGMNKTEAAYAEHLAVRQHAGEVVWFAFEAMKLRLADKTFYTPDFAVMLSDGTIEQHEVKGFWEDDARVKIKVASALFPFRFIGVKKTKGGWEFEAFTRRGV